MNFEYEEGVLALENAGGHWRIRSLWEEVPGGIRIGAVDLSHCVAQFVDNVIDKVKSELDVDLSQVTLPV